MRTVKRNPLLSGLCAALGVLAVASAAMAEMSATNPAGLVVFPKLVADEDADVDTFIQLTNTSNELIRVRCYLVNANSHCSSDPSTICTSDDDCSGGWCLPGWTETDFRFTLTKNQPIGWWLSSGMPAFPLDGLNYIASDGSFNYDSNIPRAPEDPFIGELKCFQVDVSENPVAANDLKGEATIVETDGLDVSKYNAIGLQATEFNDGNDTLCVGGEVGTDECPEPEYNGCPGVVVVDHYFDGAEEPANGDTVVSDITMVPCSQDFLTQSTFKTTVQFLVFNEFEQRLSTSRKIECLQEIQLADIDTRAGDSDDSASIFSWAVQGSIVGQSRLRAVQTSETDKGHGILVVAEQFSGGFSSAQNVHYVGGRRQGDIIRAPRE